MTYHVDYGVDGLTFSLPDCSVTVATPSGGSVVDTAEAAAAALDDPHGPPLARRVDPDANSVGLGRLSPRRFDGDRSIRHRVHLRSPRAVHDGFGRDRPISLILVSLPRHSPVPDAA